MARQSNIKLRRSATQGSIPTTSNLDLGEVAINTYDGKLYVKKSFGSIDRVVQVGSSSYSYNLATGVTETLTVTVSTSTSDHRYNGTGSGNKYFINGLPSPYLNLVPGVTYRFDQSDSSNSGHPFRFYYDASKATAYTTDVTTSGTPGNSGAYTEILATDSTPPVLHYQCSAHANMGNQASFSTRNLTGFESTIRGLFSAGTGISYNSSTGVITNSVTQYADGDARSAISVTDAGGDGSLAYNSSTGVITYTGPSAAEVRAHFSAGTGVGLSSGVISIGQAVGTSDNVQFNNVQVDGTLTSDDITSTNISIAGNATVTGNLTVSGTTTTLNTATLDVEDKNITLNAGSGDTSGSADGAGITIQDAVNSSTDATLLWDATNDRFDLSHALTITHNNTTDALLITTTEDSSSAGPVITLKRNSSSVADADYLGQLKFKGENDADQEIVYAKITGKIQDNTDTTEDGLIEFANMKAGSQTITARLRSDSLQLLNGTNLVVAGLTYPTSDGSSGQALVTDGSGNLSFSSISAGGNAFGTIAVSGQSDVVADSNSDTLTLVAGSNITLTTNAAGDSITIASSGGGGGGSLTIQDEGSALSTAGTTLNFVGAGVTATGTGATKTITIPGTGTVSEAFKTIAVSGSSDIVADSATDTLTLTAGSGMSISQDASTDTITFTSTAGSSAADIQKVFVYTATGNQTAFTGNDDNSNSLTYVAGAVQVYINGVLQKLTTDYAETNSTTITLVNGAAANDIIQIVAFYKSIGTGNSVVDQFTGDGSTTAFTVTTAPVTENNLLVYIDGVYQQKTDYTVSGTTLTMDTAPGNGAIIETVAVVGAITDQANLEITNNLTLSGLSAQNSEQTSLMINGSNVVGTRELGTAAFVDLSGGTGVTVSSGAVSIGQAVATTDNVTFADLTVTGDLNITGDINSFNVTDLDVVDKTITLGKGQTESNSGGSGIVIDGSSASILWDESNDEFDINKGLNVTGNLVIDTTTLVVDSSNNRVGIGSASPAVSLDIGSMTDAIRVPNGTTGQRPTAALGQIRYNTTTSEFEGYAAGAWGKIGGGGDSFGTLAVSGQSNVVADQENDTLTLVGAGGIDITTDASSDTVTITQNGSFNPMNTDLFTYAVGTPPAFTLTKEPASEDVLIVFVEGVYQNKNSYTLSGTTLTLDAAPGNNQEVVIHQIGKGVSGSSQNFHAFSGDGSTTAFTLSVTPLSENDVFVFSDGVYQEKSEFSVSGTTLTFGSAPANGASLEVLVPTLNQINVPAAGSVVPASLSTGGPGWDTSGNVTINTNSVLGHSASTWTGGSGAYTTLVTLSASTYRTVKFFISLKEVSTSDKFLTTEISVVHDGTDIYSTQYATLDTGMSTATFDVSLSGGNILLQVLTNASNAFTGRVHYTAIKNA